MAIAQEGRGQMRSLKRLVIAHCHAYAGCAGDMTSKQIQQLKFCFAQQIDYFEIDGKVRSNPADHCGLEQEVTKHDGLSCSRDHSSGALFSRGENSMIAGSKIDTHIQLVFVGQTRWPPYSSIDDESFSSIQCNVFRLRKWKVQESRIPLLQSRGSMPQAESLLRWNQQTTCPQVTATVAALIAVWMWPAATSVTSASAARANVCSLTGDQLTSTVTVPAPVQMALKRTQTIHSSEAWQGS